MGLGAMVEGGQEKPKRARDDQYLPGLAREERGEPCNEVTT